MNSPNHHETLVTDWSARVGIGLTPRQHLQLFERAWRAVWQRAHHTLGDVTLIAITDRVLSTAVASFPWLSGIKVTPAGPEFQELQGRASALGEREVGRATERVLTDFLTLLGNLTAEILTPALHAELSKVQRKTQRSEHEPTQHRARSKTHDQG